MAHIDEPPADVTSAGQGKDYTGAFDKATIVLVNAPLDPEHRHVGINRGEYDAYIADEIANGRARIFTDQNYQDPYRDMGLEIGLSEASKYNYARVTVRGRSWYMFCTPRMGNLTVTAFRTTLDEWPTFDWQLGYSPIERGHVAVAASQSDTYGDQYLTVPEPIDAPAVRGAQLATAFTSGFDEYVVIVIAANDLRGNGTTWPYFEHHVNEAAIKRAHLDATDATTSSGSSGGTPQVTIGAADYPWKGPATSGGAFDLFVPNVAPSPASTIDGVPAGGGVYLFTPEGYAEWLTVMQGAPWVSDGIVDIRLAPAWSVNETPNSASFTSRVPPGGPTTGWNTVASIPKFVAELTTQPSTTTVLSGWRSSILTAIGAGYYRKLITAPFCEIIVGNGDSKVSLRPDQLIGSGVDLTAVSGAAHGDFTVRVAPTGYNALGRQMWVVSGVGGNAGATRTGYGSAASNVAMQDMGPFGAAYAAISGRAVVAMNQDLAVTLGVTQQGMTLGVQGVQAALGAISAIPAGPAGVAFAGASGLSSLATTAISSSNALDILDISNDGSLDIAAFQFGVSGVVAELSFDAWRQSLYAVSGSGTAERFSGAWRALISQQTDVIISLPSVERIAACLSEWRRFGYMVGRSFEPSQLDVMTEFSYWKTGGAVITGEIPTEHKSTVAAAFDRGVTVWAHIGKIGTDVSGTNAPVGGISY